ncbi:hypothetical protein, partial [Polaromonas hydrogenivorans]|uniref:hypothetical protein n=1 Tax=Polaromonas hydrogenivorans TaxID=335476 RepID=UPI0039EFB902
MLQIAGRLPTQQSLQGVCLNGDGLFCYVINSYVRLLVVRKSRFSYKNDRRAAPRASCHSVTAVTGRGG